MTRLADALGWQSLSQSPLRQRARLYLAVPVAIVLRLRLMHMRLVRNVHRRRRAFG